MVPRNKFHIHHVEGQEVDLNSTITKEKKHPVVKVTNQDLNLTLGDDIMLPQVIEMAENALVGRENG